MMVRNIITTSIRRLFLATVAILYLTMAGLGILVLHGTAPMAHGGCLMGILEGVHCPGDGNMAGVHLEMNRFFTQAEPGSALPYLAFLPLAGTIVFLAFGWRPSVVRGLPERLRQRLRRNPDIGLHGSHGLQSWFSLIEKRDPLFLA